MMRALVLLLILFSAIPAAAQDHGVTDDDVNAVARMLYCPVCENIPLDACGTPACIQWRDEIRVQLQEGSTPQQVVDNFVNRFGDQVVGTPQDPTLRTLSLAGPWIMALVAVGVAILVIFRWNASRLRAPAVPASDTVPALSDDLDEYQQRIERDLRGGR